MQGLEFEPQTLHFSTFNCVSLGKKNKNRKPQQSNYLKFQRFINNFTIFSKKNILYKKENNNNNKI